MHNSRKTTRKWFLKDTVVSEKASWDHVGISLSGNFSSSDRSKAAADKGRSVVGALMGVGIRPGGIHPICGANIWRSFGIPSMLYECELWSNLTDSEKQLLNRTTAFAAKRMQGLCANTHSSAALGAIGMWTTNAFIDKAKLLFFEYKSVFIKRLFLCLNKASRTSRGFLPDVISLLKFYNIYEYLEDYLENCIFPSKANWKNIVVNKINQKQNVMWYEELLQKQRLLYLSRTHRNLLPLVHWEISRNHPFHRKAIANLVSILCGNVPAALKSSTDDEDQHFIYKICRKRVQDVAYHFIMDCENTNQQRKRLLGHYSRSSDGNRKQLPFSNG